MQDMQGMKEIARKTWAAGDYADLSKTLTPMAAEVVRLAGVKPGDRVLDVACGSGTTAITAARAGGRVTGVDITPELLARAKEEAAVSGVEDVEWKEGDAEMLPFPDATFDVVLSTVGHMFAPRPDVAARELVRVAKPGGRIVFATWPPQFQVGATFAALAAHGPPRPGPSPLEWGIPDVVRQRLGDAVRDVTFHTGAAYSNVLSPNGYWDLMSRKFGPVVMLLGALGNDRAKVEAVRKDFVRATEPWFRDNQVRLDYLVTRAVKR